MANNRMSDLKANIEVLPVYDGSNKKHLSTFVKQVDRLMGFVIALVPPLSDFEKFTLTNGIISRIRGKALESLDNTDTTKWEKIKETLQGQHLIFKTYATIFNEIIYLNKKDPYELYDIVSKKAKEFQDLITIEFPTDDHIITVFEKILIQNFINKINEPYSSNLANRQPGTLAELGNLLQNDYQFLKYRQPKTVLPLHNKTFERKLPNIPPQQFPKQNFPSAPVQMSFNSQRKNFAPRQNILNAQRSSKPTPMSIQTRSVAQRPNTSNYFNQQNRQFGTHTPQYIAEEINIQECTNNEKNTVETNDDKPEVDFEEISFLGIGQNSLFQER